MYRHRYRSSGLLILNVMAYTRAPSRVERSGDGWTLPRNSRNRMHPPFCFSCVQERPKFPEYVLKICANVCCLASLLSLFLDEGLWMETNLAIFDIDSVGIPTPSGFPPSLIDKFLCSHIYEVIITRIVNFSTLSNKY